MTSIKLTDTKLKYLEAYEKHGSYQKAADALGVNSKTVHTAISSIINGQTVAIPEGSMVPEGMQARRVTIAGKIDGKGNFSPGYAWSQNFREEQDLRTLHESFCKPEPLPKIKSPRSKKTTKDLCNYFTLTDAHLGMYAWEHEGDVNWNLKIAERVITETFAHLIQESPDADQAVLCVLGDYHHYDSLTPETPRSKNVVDADSRARQMIRAANRILINLTNLLAMHHRKVHVIVLEGNHDPILCNAAADWMSYLFEKNPQVTVSKQARVFDAFKWGRCMLGWHHGHEVKPKELDRAILSFQEFKNIHKTCDVMYLHTGHQHHRSMIETQLAIVEQHPILPPRDSHSSRHGYGSLRGAQVITYHKQDLEVSRVVKMIT